MESPLLKDIPGYEQAIRKARQRETFIRLAPFLPQDRRVCGIPILPLNLGHYVLLSLIASPLLVPDAPAGSMDFLSFLWIISTDYLAPGPTVSRSASKKARVKWIARHGPRVVRSLERADGLARMAKRLRAEVHEALYDCPQSSGDPVNAHAVNFVATILDEFAAEYKWPRAEIFATPLAILLQCRRARVLRAHPSAVLTSPSDRVGRAVLRKHLAKAKKKARKS